MQLTSNNAILLDVKENSFKGKDGNTVTYNRARVIDDENNYHEITVPSDFDWQGEDPAEINRLETTIVIDVEERNNKIKKRLSSIG